jgi:hypothetical protein
MATRGTPLAREQADSPLRPDAESDAAGDVERQMSTDVDTSSADPERGEPERRSQHPRQMRCGRRHHRHHHAGMP